MAEGRILVQLDPREWEARQDAFKIAAQPFVLTKLHIQALGFRGYELDQDGNLRTLYDPHAQAQLAIIDKHIDWLLRYFLAVLPEDA